MAPEPSKPKASDNEPANKKAGAKEKEQPDTAEHPDDAGPLAPAAAGPQAPAQAQGQPVVSRSEQYRIATRPVALLSSPARMLPPLDPRTVEEVLATDPAITLHSTHRVQGLRRASMSSFGPPDIHFASMSPERATSLKQEFGERVVVERDMPLRHGPIVGYNPASPLPGLTISASSAARITVPLLVVGGDGQGIAGAQVTIFGGQGSYAGTTDANGHTAIDLVGESVATITDLVAIPHSDYWMTWIHLPRLDQNQDNIISLIPLQQQFPDFPESELFGWGLSAMGVDQLPALQRGQGVRVAVVDTGIAATTHPDLKGQVEDGVSLVDADSTAWSKDVEGHGTHVAGIIAGLPNGSGVRGIAPGVKLRAYKIFPGGGNELITALDHIIEMAETDHPVDIVNLSLGQSSDSQLIEGRIVEARTKGIACIVAAGNSWGAVDYPGRSPQVLTVAALGKRETFPAESWHATEAFAENGVGSSPEGYFSANFTAWGPEVDLCAPGVAIVSCFPPDGYAAWDGTSMATPYVVGLAALVLAHHPDFQEQGPFRARNSQRVDRLFEILRQSALPVTLGDSPNVTLRVGAGLASSQALGIAAAGAATAARLAPGNGTLTPAEIAQLRALLTDLLTAGSRR